MIVAVVPCRNEESHVGSVVARTVPLVDLVIVVDNLSTDSSMRAAADAGARVASCNVPGVGAVTRLGVQLAVRAGADAVVTLDGDGQHDPQDIPRLLTPVRSGICDLAVGSRTDRNRMPHYRRFGNDVISLVHNLGAGQRLKDTQCGFRAFSRSVAEWMLLATTESGFGFIAESLIKARHAGYRILEVPVSCVYHDRLSDNSSMNPVRHGVGAVVRTARWRVWELTGH